MMMMIMKIGKTITQVMIINHKMKKLMQMLLLRLFGHKPVTNLPRTVTKFNSVYPQNQPSFQEWVEQYRVSMLWDRRAINID